MRWMGHVARIGEINNSYNTLAVKPEGKRPPGKPTCKYQDNIKIDLKEIGWEDVDWIHLVQDRNLQIP
jgi:hypothetical protein